MLMGSVIGAAAARPLLLPPAAAWTAALDRAARRRRGRAPARPLPSCPPARGLLPCRRTATRCLCRVTGARSASTCRWGSGRRREGRSVGMGVGGLCWGLLGDRAALAASAEAPSRPAAAPPAAPPARAHALPSPRAVPTQRAATPTPGCRASAAWRSRPSSCPSSSRPPASVGAALPRMPASSQFCW